MQFENATVVPHDSPYRQFSYKPFFLRHYFGIRGPLTLRTVFQDSLGTLEEKELFRPHETGVFPFVYVRKDTSHRTIADKVFVEVFDTPTEILYLRTPKWVAGDFYFRRVSAISLNFTRFVLLRDETIVTVDENRLVAVRLTRDLDSPFFKQDGHVLAIGGPLFRRWIAAARARLPKRYDQSDIKDAQDYMPVIDAELTENILHEWRRGK